MRTHLLAVTPPHLLVCWGTAPPRWCSARHAGTGRWQGRASQHRVRGSHPFIYFPTFFTLKSLVERQPHPLEHAWHKWRDSIWSSCKALWAIWVPAQIVNFAFVPRYLRVPFGALAGPGPRMPPEAASALAARWPRCLPAPASAGGRAAAARVLCGVTVCRLPCL